MVLFLHGAAGGFDELAVGVVAFAVLWFAVKLAGRKPSNDADEEDEVAPDDLHADSGETQTEAGHTTPTKLP
jgi:hypothetical protein